MGENVKNQWKCVVVTWLFRTDLANLNAGEGSSNLKEIKTYRNGLPYISGQSVRHALRKAIQREHPDAYKCTVEYPCGNIKDCWLCDIFGYLLPGEGAKRWSAVKVSPAMGQVRRPVATDLILRLVNDIECPRCHKKINPLFGREAGIKAIDQGSTLKCPECKKDFEAPYAIRQAIAYKQLIENTYRVALTIDLNALGIEEVPKIEGEGKKAKMNGIKYDDKYGDNGPKERIKRAVAVLTAISNLSDFASQSREMTNASPDFILISLQKQYNQRLSSALQMNESEAIDKERFKGIIDDCLKMPDTKIYAGAISGTFTNDNVIVNILKNEAYKNKVAFANTPREALMDAIGELEKGTNN